MPILVIADDDRKALCDLVEMLPDYHVVTAHNWSKVREYTETFEPDVVLMADTLQDPEDSFPTMVERLFRVFHARVIVLSDFLSPDAPAKWRERGAVDCVLHPTRSLMRLAHLKRRIQKHVVMSGAE